MPRRNAPATRNGFRRKALRFNLGLALLVWAVWIAWGGSAAIHEFFANWKIALTMVFGSLVGGGTSEGGGAVAFPVFTKLLHISPADARNFSFAIQSVGMGAASISILYLRIPIARRTLLYAGASGVIGVTLGAMWVAPFVAPALVRVSFTVLVSSLGLAVLLINRSEHAQRHERMPLLGGREKAILVAAGLAGGLVSALVGCGENTVAFMVMVLLFRISEKVATPTTVILMTIVALTGFALHLWFFRDFSPAVMGYWRAAVPVVVVGAPLGALACSYMSRRAIVFLLLGLIALEFVSTLLLIPMSRALLLTSAATLAVCASINLAMSRAKIYRPEHLASIGSQNLPDVAQQATAPTLSRQ